MRIDITEILKAIGPAASIIFAAWIFMGFLQQRYDAAIARYMAMIEQFRSKELSERRRRSLRIEIASYKRRCNLMNAASIVGMISAIALITTLIVGEGAIIFPGIASLQYVSASLAVLGFLLVIVASIIVLIEGTIIHQQIGREVEDIDLAE